MRRPTPRKPSPRTFTLEGEDMSKISLLSILAIAAFLTTGCARPNELGYSSAYTAKERGDQIARNWDLQGKQVVDDIDHILLLRPASNLSIWNVRGGY
jgi:hypothetical protein